jgi:osmoprotectant transport system substrate-binding protein
MRRFRMAALGASVLALIVGACQPGGGGAGSPTSAATQGSPAASGATLASTLVLGAPPECPQRPFCAVGLKDKYGIEFKEIKALDPGGPLTVAAVEKGDVQVGLLFTSDPNIAAKNFVLLQDDKQLQLADNLIPVIRKQVLDASPEIRDLINPWMAKLTQEQLTALNKRVSVDQEDSRKVVQEWLAQNGLQAGGGSGKPTIKVGSTNFYEQEILGEIFAQVLEASGYKIERKFNLGNREIVFPALQSGQIDVLAEYIATALEFVNKSAGEATSDPAATAQKFNERLGPLNLVALDYAPATDQNGFVVTKATADQYGLTKLSDLTKPAP